MGKKDKKSTAASKVSPSENFKELGNKAYLAGKFQEAVDFYTQAVDSSPSKNHIYFGNRANALLELGEFS